MKITIDNRIKNVKAGPPELLYAPRHLSDRAAKILLNLFGILKPQNWEMLEYARVSFTSNKGTQPNLDFLISLDIEKFIGAKLRILARWKWQDKLLFYGEAQKTEEDCDNLSSFVELEEHLLLNEVISTVSLGLATVIRKAVKSKVDNLTCNMDYLLSSLNIEQSKE